MKKKGKGPSDHATIEQRVTEIIKIYLAGGKRADVLQYASRNEWKLTDRAVDNLIAKANEELKAISKRDREVEFGKAISRLEDLYIRALKAGKLSICRQVQKEISEHYGNKVFKISPGDDEGFGINAKINASEEVKKAIDHLLARKEKAKKTSA